MKKVLVCFISFFIFIPFLLTSFSCKKNTAPELQQDFMLIPSQKAMEAGDWGLNQVFLPGEQASDDPMNVQDLLNNENIQVILLHFWASWDQPAGALMPSYEALYQKYLDKGLIVLGITIDEKSDVLLAQIQDRMLQYQLSYPILWDHDKAVMNSYGIGAIPVTYLIDKQSKIRYERSGFTSKEVDIPPLEEAIKVLLKK